MIDQHVLGCFYYINRSSSANPSREFDEFLKLVKLVLKMGFWQIGVCAGKLQAAKAHNYQRRRRVYCGGGSGLALRKLGEKEVSTALQVADRNSHPICGIVGMGWLF